MIRQVRYGILTLTFASLTYLAGCKVAEKEPSEYKQEPILGTTALVDVDKNRQLDLLCINKGNLEIFLKVGHESNRVVVAEADHFDVKDIDGDGRLDIRVQKGSTLTIFRQTTPGKFERIPE
ncbi:VCBS repeat-containing protein [Candidatus Woesearchaeota archaeon]|nr:VCBS repeat-containing protein [Candidatus Woesearchaeota archaeon]